MKYILNNIRVPVQNEQDIPAIVCSILKIKSDVLQNWTLVRRALDTRRKNAPLFVYTIELELDSVTVRHPDLTPYKDITGEKPPATKLTDPHPVIIGMGPAGLFCALAMVEHGLKPILYDRGDNLEQRAEAVNKFWSDGALDLESNVQFGEGGAGTFSDGKLTSRTANASILEVYDILIRFGAPESIRWEALPHLGTEVIRLIVQNIRNYLIEKDCAFHYRNKLNDLTIRSSVLEKIIINDIVLKPELLVLALGNSARDTFKMLSENGVSLEPKPFALGFRISHPQAWLNQLIYGNNDWAEQLGAASYRLTASSAGKGTYTFCMCPGGFIIAATSEPNAIVTNGMSFSARDLTWGNSAIVTQVNASVYGSGLWSGMEFQAKLEQAAFIDKYAAPIQRASDYLRGTLSNDIKLPCLFPCVQSAQISDIFPAHINLALYDGLKHFDRILPGFIKQGIIIAPETRTSSPIRILRDKDNLNCSGISNLYAVGEGSGYSGGIISSAADGFRVGSIFRG